MRVKFLNSGTRYENERCMCCLYLESSAPTKLAKYNHVCNFSFNRKIPRGRADNNLRTDSNDERHGSESENLKTENNMGKLLNLSCENPIMYL